MTVPVTNKNYILEEIKKSLSMRATSQYRIIRPKIKDKNVTKLYFYSWFYTDMNLGLSRSEKNVDRGC
jgi:hypothetical protein